MTLRPGAQLRHFKGKPYQFLFYATHSETLEEHAVYECLYENDRSKLWIRPRQLFEGLLPEPSGAPSTQRRFAEVLDEDGEPERLSGCSHAQLGILAARHNALAWQGIDEWQDSTLEEREETLESAFAALALAREADDLLGVARAHWLVAYVLLMAGRAAQAEIHAEANARCISSARLAQPVDKALSLEMRARVHSVKNAPEAPEMRDAAQAEIKALKDEQQRHMLELAFEKGPW